MTRHLRRRLGQPISVVRLLTVSDHPGSIGRGCGSAKQRATSAVVRAPARPTLLSASRSWAIAVIVPFVPFVYVPIATRRALSRGMKTLAPDQIPARARQLEEPVAGRKANLKAHRSSSTCRTARLPRGGSGTQEPLAGQPERWRRCQIQTPEVALPEESVTPRAVSATARTTALTAGMTSAPLHPTAETRTKDSSPQEAWLRGGGSGSFVVRSYVAG